MLSCYESAEGQFALREKPVFHLCKQNHDLNGDLYTLFLARGGYKCLNVCTVGWEDYCNCVQQNSEELVTNLHNCKVVKGMVHKVHLLMVEDTL